MLSSRLQIVTCKHQLTSNTCMYFRQNFLQIRITQIKIIPTIVQCCSPGSLSTLSFLGCSFFSPVPSIFLYKGGISTEGWWNTSVMQHISMLWVTQSRVVFVAWCFFLYVIFNFFSCFSLKTKRQICNVEEMFMNFAFLSSGSVNR